MITYKTLADYNLSKNYTWEPVPVRDLTQGNYVKVGNHLGEVARPYFVTLEDALGGIMTLAIEYGPKIRLHEDTIVQVHTRSF